MAESVFPGWEAPDALGLTDATSNANGLTTNWLNATHVGSK
jgi:hypothetical protein